MCPVCRRQKLIPLLPTTRCTDVVVYCKICRAELVLNIPLVPVP